MPQPGFTQRNSINHSGIPTLLGRSTWVSRRVTRNKGLTRVGSCNHVNTYCKLSVEGLTLCGGLKTTPAYVKGALGPTVIYGISSCKARLRHQPWLKSSCKARMSSQHGLKFPFMMPSHHNRLFTRQKHQVTGAFVVISSQTKPSNANEQREKTNKRQNYD